MNIENYLTLLQRRERSRRLYSICFRPRPWVLMGSSLTFLETSGAICHMWQGGYHYDTKNELEVHNEDLGDRVRNITVCLQMLVLLEVHNKDLRERTIHDNFKFVH